ncbi:cache domain-containing protein [Patescibacteria group bacterium]|nr:cache domain-containing protein [Patescibacteria group bacterium]MBU1721417.1 cache domain-containing protein [Patescibacteria group bacterium]MBU1901857.1 cache domain-containing protein [Patescibacteria group bacterium]
MNKIFSLSKPWLFFVVLLFTLSFGQITIAQEKNTTTQEIQPPTFEETAIKLRAIEVAREVETYLEDHPEKTLAELKEDPAFQTIAVQPVGKTGYTAILDFDLIVQFHKQPTLIDFDAHLFQEDFPELFDILIQSEEGNDSSGYYLWKDENGISREKYNYQIVVHEKTADNKGLIISATTYLDEYTQTSTVQNPQKSIDELATELKAKETAQHINEYLITHPELTLADLQEDELFQTIAIQAVGETGYTGVIDSETGYFYFHPQKRLENTDSHLLKEELPDWWAIFERTMGEECQPNSGYYTWKEGDDSLTEKFLSTACVKNTTADGKKLFVGATNYIDQQDASKYIEKYEITKDFLYAKDAIKQKAKDVAKQIEIYIKANPEKTIKELQQDEYFTDIAVQPVGKTGYTAVTDYTTLYNRFHTNPAIIDSNLHDLAEKLPEFYRIISTTIGGQEAEGIYDWKDADGSINEKYMYIAIVDAKTADGVGLSVAATTYLDEFIYLGEETNNQFLSPLSKTDNYIHIIYWLFGAIVIIFFIIALLYYFKIIRIERITLLIFLSLIFILISAVFLNGSFYTVNKLKDYFKNNYIEQFTQLEELLSEEFSSILKNMGDDLDTLAEAYTSETEIHDSEQTHPEILSLLLKSSFETNKTYVHASYRINKHGIITDMYPIDLNSIGADISEQEHMQKIKQTKEPVLSNIFDTVEGFQGVTLHYPVIKNGEYDGTVAFLINVDKLSSLISQFTSNIYPHDSFLFDNNGQIITSNVKEVKHQNIFDLEVFRDKKLPATDGNKTNVITEKENEIFIYLPITLLDNTWFIAFSGQEQDAYYGLDKTLTTIWIFTIITFALFVIFGSIFSYFLTRSLRLEVNKKTKEIKDKAKETVRIEKQLAKKETLNKKQLEKKIKELESFQKLMVGRELKMVQLKKEIEEKEKKKGENSPK